MPFGTIKDTAVDMICILIIIPKEDIGVIRAAKNFDLPVAISFAVESSGNLCTGESLSDVIGFVDQAINTLCTS